uniref:UPF0235 protein MAGMO_3507 n=1 Tax=Magnetococcus massalia (strain MO-1) TaxID=451514 RepID=A0A1S7LMJ7_MAGMO|nr:Conserved protein of unknown function. Similar to the Mmc1_3654 from Magnetococcus sp. (strain MC-1), which belong to the UPF0235 family, function still unkonown [Candidatus Magnetococcus massalia]
MPQPGVIWSDRGLLLEVKVQPKASRERVMGWQNGMLKIALNAPPVDGAANQALCVFLADQLGVGKRSVQLIRGDKSRQKRLLLEGVEVADWDLFVQKWGL